MGQALVTSKRKTPEKTAEETKDWIERGINVNEIVVDFGTKVDPEKVLQTLTLIIGKLKVEMVIRHAELKDYLVGAANGAIIGGALGGAWALLEAAVTVGTSLELTTLIAKIGLGALIGFFIGTAAVPVSSVRIYKYKGATRMKLLLDE